MECRKAEYLGKVLQYTDYTYSRYSFNENPELVDKLKEKIEGMTVITFQSIESLFDTKYHFGNVEGLNSCKGNDIAVIGLPNLNELVYCLYGIRFGVHTWNFHMYSRRIRYNNYDFRVNTFEDKSLSRIQMWFISSQLEKAVGRARLFRNNCTVKVFSRFPVEQAVFFQENS